MSTYQIVAYNPQKSTDPVRIVADNITNQSEAVLMRSALNTRVSSSGPIYYRVDEKP